MPADNIEVGREYTEAEVTALHEDRRPQPLRPFAINTPAPRQGRGLMRRSTHGDKWCPYCNTPLNTALRAQSCERCRPGRERALDRLRHENAAAEAPPSASQQNFSDIQRLLTTIDELTRVVGVAYSMRARNGGMSAEHSMDILVASKDVTVASDALRRRVRPRPDAQGG